MSWNSVFTNRIVMLLACGSPGSALAFQSLPAISKAEMPRRGKANGTPAIDLAIPAA